jgi:serine/threonine protein kinase
MGEVFRARDTRLGRDVALKVLPDRFVSDPDRIARFLRDAHLAKRQEALVAPEDRGIEMRSHFSNLPPLVV